MSIVTITGKKGGKGDKGEKGIRGDEGPVGKTTIDHTFIVTVVSNESNNLVFSIDGELQKPIYLYRGYVYIFDQTDQSNLDSDGQLKYPIKLSTTNPINDRVILFSSQLLADSDHSKKFFFEVTNDVPDNLYYFCENPSIMGGNMKILLFTVEYIDGMKVIVDDSNIFEIKPKTIGTSGQAILSDGSGGVFFGDIIQKKLESSINLNNNIISNLPYSTEPSHVSNKSYVDSKINDNEITLTNTWSSTKIDIELAKLPDYAASKINDDSTTSDTIWSSAKLNIELPKVFSGINYNLTGLKGETDKVNLLVDSTQPIKGTSMNYTISGPDISNGQPMIQDYSNGTITATEINVIPNAWKFIGIATNSTASGGECSIVHNGFVTARYTSIPQQMTENTVKLDSSTNTTTLEITGKTIFTDSGSVNGTYNDNEKYYITFDAGSGNTIDYNIVALEFEHTTNKLYDRLGVQLSDNGFNFYNPSFRGWHTTSSSNITDTTYFGVNYQFNLFQTYDINGNVLPSSTSFITSHGGSLSGTFGSRYVRFYFYSNTSVTKAGWNIELSLRNTPSTPIPIDTPLYLDPDDFTKVSEKNYTDFLVGYCAFENTDNNSIYMRVSTVKQ